MSGPRDLRWFELTFPTSLDPDVVVGFMRSLAARSRRGWLGRGRAITFEIETHGRDWQWRIGIPEHDVSPVIQQLRTLMPQVGYQPTTRTAPALARGVELRLRSPFRSTRTDLPTAVSAAVLGAMTSLGREERLVVQWTVGPWLPRSAVPNPTDRDRQPMPWRLFESGVVLDSESTGALRRKQTEPVFGVVGRIAVAAEGRARQEQLLRRVFGGLQVARDPGVGLVRRVATGPAVAARVARCALPALEWPCALNAAELGSLIGWPIGGPALPGVTYQTSRLLPAPPRAVASDTVGMAVASTFLDERLRRVGAATYPGQAGSLVLRPHDALRHVHLLGPSGSGKSHLLANLVVQDIAAGRGVVVIEPKSDLIERVLERIPAHRLDDVVVLDGSGADSPVGINPLAGVHPGNRELVVDQMLGLLHSLWRDSWGPRTNDVLHAGLLTIAASDFPSLVALPALFTNDLFRRTAVARALRSNPWGLDAFWAWFEALSVEQRAQVLGPVMSKLRAFLLRPSMRAILGQTQPRFAMREVLTERKVLLVDLAKGSIGPEASALLGSIVLAQLWQAIQSRSGIDPARRHPVMVHVDEFQDYTHGTTDFADVLTQARGLGVGVTVSHQHLSQLDNTLRDAVLANAQSRVLFRLEHRDARTMAEGHPELTSNDLGGLGRYEIYTSLVTDGTPSPYASGRTTELPAPLSSAGDVRTRSKWRYGVPASSTDEALRSLTNDASGATAKPDGDDDWGDEFGVRRTT